MTLPKILITDCDHGFLTPEQEVASRRKADLVVANGDLERVGEHLPSADALLTQYFQVTDELLDRAPSCRVVGRYGVGVDNIDLAAAERRGIRTVNVPDFCVDEVADHAMALALMALRRIPLLDRAWRHDPQAFTDAWSGRFEYLKGVERSGKLRFGLLGFGRTGRAVATRARSFGFAVGAHDPLVDQSQMRDAGVRSESLEEVLAGSDVVSLHMAATDETRGIIGEEALASMKPGVVIVNTARGTLVDEGALLAALRSGHVGFAALDVTAVEPLPIDHPLLTEPRALVTPHVAFFSATSLDQLKATAMSNVLDALERGDRP